VWLTRWAGQGVHLADTQERPDPSWGVCRTDYRRSRNLRSILVFWSHGKSPERHPACRPVLPDVGRLHPSRQALTPEPTITLGLELELWPKTNNRVYILASLENGIHVHYLHSIAHTIAHTTARGSGKKPKLLPPLCVDPNSGLEKIPTEPRPRHKSKVHAEFKTRSSTRLSKTSMSTHPSTPTALPTEF
jgi:hypothetical protein